MESLGVGSVEKSTVVSIIILKQGKSCPQQKTITTHHVVGKKKDLLRKGSVGVDAQGIAKRDGKGFSRCLFCVPLERNMNYSCYCLVSETGKTYVGFSTNVDRRLRQHNGEITGGARATHGSTWKRICTVTGFPTQQSALQFEWKWKHISRKEKGVSPMHRRASALLVLLNSESSTSKAVAFSTYDGPLLVLGEDESFCSLLRGKEMTYGLLIE